MEICKDPNSLDGKSKKYINEQWMKQEEEDEEKIAHTHTNKSHTHTHP